MKSKNAAEAATAKPCIENDAEVTLPTAVVDTIFKVTDASVSVLQGYRDSMMQSGASEGVWIGGEEAALDLAVVSAAIEGARDVMVELGGEETVTLTNGSTITLRSGVVPEATEPLVNRLRFQSIAEHNQMPNEVEPVDPEALARAKLAANDRARGETGRRWTFNIDPDGTYDVESVDGLTEASCVLMDAAEVVEAPELREHLEKLRRTLIEDFLS